MPYFRVTGYQPPYLAPRYSAKSVMSRSLSGNLNGSSFVPMMMSGPAPTLAATAAFGRMSSQLSASTRTLTPVFSTNFLVLAVKLSNSDWTNCFQRSTLSCAPGSGAGPFHVRRRLRRAASHKRCADRRHARLQGVAPRNVVHGFLPVAPRGRADAASIIRPNLCEFGLPGKSTGSASQAAQARVRAPPGERL